MSGFGKFLIVLNFLAAAAFAALLVLDYRERDAKYVHAIEKANRVIEGDPPDKEAVAKEFLVKGQAIPTQEDEVRKVQTELQGKVDATEALPLKDQKLETKLQKLAWALRPYANTFSRREALNRLMGDPNPDPDKFPLLFDAAAEQQIKQLPKKEDRLAEIAKHLQDDLTRVFALQDEDGKPRKGEDKRMAIAHTLFGAAESLRAVQSADAAPFTLFDKVVTVIGLETAIHEVAIEITTLRGMTHEAEYAIERDREAFVREHEALLRTANALADELKDAQNLVLSKQGEFELGDKDRRQQEANVKRLTGELAEARRKTKGLLDTQKQHEDVIFKKQTELRNAEEQNRSLERQLRQLEAKFRGKEVAR